MMLLIEHPSATCPECNEPLLYGTKEEASSWKMYYECSARCASKPFEEYSDGGGSVLFGVVTGIIGVGVLVAAYLL